MRGIDVSTHQKGIDWKKVYNAGYRFAFIRVGYRGYTNGSMNEDKYFKANIKGASEAGMKIGLYFFSTAISEKEAVEDAQFVLDRIKGYEVELPIVFDFEGFENKEYRTYGCTKAQRTAFCKAFAETVIKAGYNTMLYGSKGNIRTTYDCDELQYPMWIAQYTGGYKKIIDDEQYFPKMGAYVPRVAIWQYTSIGKVDGISGNVDLNKMYIDLPNYKMESENQSKDTKDDAYKTFVKGVQKACGAKVDGIAGPETLSKTVTISHVKNIRHAVVKPVQQYLNELGYPCGKADGIFGSKTRNAVIAFQKANGCVSDGEITSKKATWKKLLKL